MIFFRTQLIRLFIIMITLLSITSVYAINDDIVKALQFYTQNHEILAQNISSSDMPGYKALEAEDVTKYMQATRNTVVNLTVTHSNHLVGKKRSNIRIRKQTDTYETKPNGNNVSIAQQLQKIAKNQLNHRTVNEIMAKTNKILISALGKNG